MSEPAHGPAYAELRAEIEELRSDIKVIIKSRDKWLVACKDRDATITSLREEVERLKEHISEISSIWQKQFKMDNAALSKAGEEIDSLRSRLAACENERDELRKVVWLLECGCYPDTWTLSDKVARANNIDIAKLQREMGK